MVNGVIESERMEKLFAVLQNKMQTELAGIRTFIEHPTTIGDNYELKWIEWLRKYLPERYCIDKAHIIDSRGELSQQIDVVVYDRQYTPFIFNDGWAKYIPAESVYAIFEVKPVINKAHLIYAGEKAASVRALYRTSYPIIHAGGEYKPIRPKIIIAGILTYGCEWADGLQDTFKTNLIKLDDSNILNIGCSLTSGSFYINKEEGVIQISKPEESLVYFFLKLFKELQKMGTVPAMDINEYGKFLTNF